MKIFVRIFFIVFLLFGGILTTTSQTISDLQNFFNYNSYEHSTWKKDHGTYFTDRINVVMEGPYLTLKYTYNTGTNTCFKYNYTIDLRNAVFYVGYWYKRGFSSDYVQGGDKGRLTIEGTIKSHFESRGYYNSPDSKDRTVNNYYINCFNDRDADNLLKIFKALQKTYKSPEPWETQYVEQEVEESSLSLKELFTQLSKSFKEYKIDSNNPYYYNARKTIIKSLYYEHPYLTINYKEVSTGGWSDSDFKPGQRKVKINLLRAKVLHKGETLRFKDDDGIEFTENGSKTIIKDFQLYASELICNKLCTNLLQLKNKIREQNFTGKLSTYAPKKSVSKSRINKSKKIGKYVQ